MTGTFGGALEARKIPADQGRLRSTAVGEIEVEGRVLVIKRIHVTYRLEVGADVDREAVERVMRVHADRCPVYRSIHPQIHVTTSLELEEA
ncbi:MAG: OsmC family protein [Actinobacteria bacterium]|nr:OsmC family protein [Actinomycetota bacterium]